MKKRSSGSNAPAAESPSVPATRSVASEAVAAAEQLRDAVEGLDFSGAVAWVYNPLRYAWGAHRQYVERYAQASCEVLFLGMNPGPWGMAQTGVPFGQVAAARDWLKIDGRIEAPEREHPKRPIEGWECQRSEVSGERLWGLFAARYGEPEDFFRLHYVANYCPLVFMEQSARNVTPDKLPARCRGPLEEICDAHLSRLVAILRPSWVVGVGSWAEGCAQRVAGSQMKVGRILHPSPASPAANRDWAGTVTRQLQALGIWHE